MTVRRWLAAAAGVGAVAWLLHHAGLSRVGEALSHAAPYFPWILLLEGGILACTMCALRVLYGEDRSRIPTGALVSAGLIGYAIMGLLPAGRAVAEAGRAALLAKYSSGPRATSAAIRLQALALLANAAISLPAGLAVLAVTGFSVPAALIFANLVATAVLGGGILLAARHSRLGVWLGRWFPAIRRFGSELDGHMSAGEPLPFKALSFEFFGRCLQVVQNGVLVLAVSGKLGMVSALCSEALHLIGAAAGDLIPAQMGATEASYQLSSSVLGLSPSQAVTIALLAHLAQVAWIGVGLLIPVLIPAMRPAEGAQ